MISSESGNGDRFRLASVSKGLIGLGVSAGFAWLTLRGVNLGEVQSHLKLIELGALPPVLTSLALIFTYKAFRWQYQMSPLRYVGFIESLSAVTIGFMANNAIPLRGGDVLRAHVLARRENIATAGVFATVVLERIFDVVSLVTVSLMLLLVIPFPHWIRESVIILGIAILASLVGIMTIRRRAKLLERCWNRGCRLVPHKAQEFLSLSIKQARDGLKTAGGKARLTNLYILALGEWVLWGLLVKFSLQALGIQLSIPAIISTIIAANLAVMFPAVPGYIGVFHYAVMATLGFYHFDKSIALSGAVVLHAIFVIPVSLVGFIFFVREWLIPKGIAI